MSHARATTSPPGDVRHASNRRHQLPLLTSGSLLYRYDDLNECFWLRGQLVLLSPDLFTQSGDARRERRQRSRRMLRCAALAPATDEAAPLGDARQRQGRAGRRCRTAASPAGARDAEDRAGYHFGKTYFQVTGGPGLPHLLPRIDLARRSLHILAAAVFGGSVHLDGVRHALALGSSASSSTRGSAPAASSSSVLRSVQADLRIEGARGWRQSQTEHILVGFGFDSPRRVPVQMYL